MHTKPSSSIFLSKESLKNRESSIVEIVSSIERDNTPLPNVNVSLTLEQANALGSSFEQNSKNESIKPNFLLKVSKFARLKEVSLLLRISK